MNTLIFKAHQTSKISVIDPAYSSESVFPTTEPLSHWHCIPGEYEAFMLAKMRRDTKRLKLLVGYPGHFREPSAVVWFRRECTATNSVEYSINGNAEASFNNAPLTLDLSAALFTPPAQGTLLLKVSVADAAETLPSISSLDETWEASLDGITYTRTEFCDNPDGYKYPRLRVPLTEISPHVFDAGREILADISFHCTNKPSFTCGESLHEALNVTAATAEQTFELVRDDADGWHTPLPLAFRYIKVESNETPPPVVDGVFYPLQYKGAFSADTELNRIWMCAAYTLRLCTGIFQIDGIKRDRLPWAGDLAIALLSNAYVFADPKPVLRTLRLLNDGFGESQVNGIIDYSLWLVISHDLFQRFFGDVCFLRESYPTVKRILNWFMKRHDTDGGLIQMKSDDWFFIDWVTMNKSTSVEMLYHWALRSGAALADRMGDSDSAAEYRQRASEIRDRLFKTAFDSTAGLFRSDTREKTSALLRHPNFLAILSGVADNATTASIGNALVSDEMPQCGTPYMSSCEIWALYLAGYKHEALAKIRHIWGAMLKHDATTFWEGWEDNCNENSMHVFYDRAFGKSLCHAWSSAPVALLPMIIFDAVPTKDGFTGVTLSAPLLDGAQLKLPK